MRRFISLIKLPQTLFGKMLLVVAVIPVVAVLIISFVLSYDFERVTLRNVKETSTKLLSQMSHSANYMHQNAFNFSVALFNDPNIIPLMYQDEVYDEKQIVNEMAAVKHLMGFNSYVESVYIYNRNLKRIYIPGQSAIAELEQFEDREVLPYLLQPEEGSRFTPIPRSLNGKKVFTYFAYDLYSAEKGAYGAVIVNVKADYLLQLMEAFMTKASLPLGDTFVIDSQGNIVVAANEQAQHDSIQSVIKAVLPESRGSDSFVAGSGNNRKLISYVSSEVSGWRFVQSTPYELLILDIQKMRETIVYVCLLLVVLGLLASFVFTSRLFSPLRRLIAHIEQLNGTKSERADEVHYLNKVFSESHKSFQQSLNTEKSLFLQQLLQGRQHSPAQLEESVKKYGRESVILKCDHNTNHRQIRKNK